MLWYNSEMPIELSDLSILIVTWNGDDLLRDCLGSIAKSCDVLPEVVVVDNAGRESTRELVSQFANAKYIAADHNLGFAGGNNLGFPHCTRPYVLLLNNDTIIRDEPFSTMIRYLEDHPKVAVVQGKMRLVRMGDVLDSCGEMLTPFGVGYDEFVHRDCTRTRVRTGPVYFAKGALLLMHRSIVDRLGGILFHDFFMNNYEEADFCYRVWMSGNEVHFVDTPVVDHLQGQSIRRLDVAEMSGRSLANMWFSLSANLEKHNRRRVLSRLLCLQVLLFGYMLLCGHWGKLKSWIVAFREIRGRRERLVAIRKVVQQCRVSSDCEIFKLIMVKPGLMYYFHLFRGDAENYTLRHEVGCCGRCRRV